MFGPISKETSSQPNRYYEKIIEAISDQIADNTLKEGDVLPSERELAEAFQLSRVPVREALKILEFLGMIAYEPGKGMVVKKLEISSLLSKVFFGLNTSGDIMEQLFDLRLLMEPFAARQAAQCATQADLAQIKGVLDGAQASAAHRSVDFHGAIFHASHNTLMEELYGFLNALLSLLHNQTRLEERYEENPTYFHGEIYAAIANQNPNHAEALMRAHLETERANLRKMQQLDS